MTFTTFFLAGIFCFAVGFACGWLVRRETRADDAALRRSREHLDFCRRKKSELDSQASGRRA